MCPREASDPPPGEPAPAQPALPGHSLQLLQDGREQAPDPRPQDGPRDRGLPLPGVPHGGHTAYPLLQGLTEEPCLGSVGVVLLLVARCLCSIETPGMSRRDGCEPSWSRVAFHQLGTGKLGALGEDRVHCACGWPLAARPLSCCPPATGPSWRGWGSVLSLCLDCLLSCVALAGHPVRPEFSLVCPPGRAFRGFLALHPGCPPSAPACVSFPLSFWAPFTSLARDPAPGPVTLFRVAQPPVVSCRWSPFRLRSWGWPGGLQFACRSPGFGQRCPQSSAPGLLSSSWAP